MLTHKDNLQPNSPIVAVGNAGVEYLLTNGKKYVALYGKEDGIFESRPFVTVIADDGKRHSFHMSRFTLPTNDKGNI